VENLLSLVCEVLLHTLHFVRACSIIKNRPRTDPFSKHAEVTVPSLDDWEKEWGENSQRSVQPKLLPVDFRSTLAEISQAN
jgi:hypothetical protein